MSAPKFTPGPWHWVNAETDAPYDFTTDPDGFSYADGFPSLRTVAEDRPSMIGRKLPTWILDADPVPYGNDEANARLIAAAPDMFAVLERLESAIGITDLEDCVALARAALAKARGEA